MGAATGLDGDDALTLEGLEYARKTPGHKRSGDPCGLNLRWKGIVLGQKLAVLAGEDVVCHCSDGEASAEGLAESQHECCFP